jgi:hypothetical protein
MAEPRIYYLIYKVIQVCLADKGLIGIYEKYANTVSYDHHLHRWESQRIVNKLNSLQGFTSYVSPLNVQGQYILLIKWLILYLIGK